MKFDLLKQELSLHIMKGNKESGFKKNIGNFTLPLKKSLDNVYEVFCFQLAGENKNNTSTLPELVEHQERQATLKTAIAPLQIKIKGAKQFNKFELNQELNNLKKELATIEKGTPEKA